MNEPGPFRCTHCGNKTRFDLHETVSRRRYAHYGLDGVLASIDEEETESYTLHRVVCRWCNSTDGVVEVDA